MKRFATGHWLVVTVIASMAGPALGVTGAQDKPCYDFYKLSTGNALVAD